MDEQDKKLNTYFVSHEKYDKLYGDNFLLIMKNDDFYNIFEKRSDKGYPEITKKTMSLVISVWEIKRLRVCVTGFHNSRLDEFINILLEEGNFVIIIDENGEEIKTYLQG